MERIKLIFVLIIFLQLAESFIFSKDKNEETIRQTKEPVMESRYLRSEYVDGWFRLFSKKADEIDDKATGEDSQYMDGWFGLFSKKADESDDKATGEDSQYVDGWFGLFSKKADESDDKATGEDSNLSVLSKEWFEKYTEMISELSKMKTALKESNLPVKLLNKYNTTMNHLAGIKESLEVAFDSEVMEKFNSTVDAVVQTKKVFLSYDWFQKYSDALETLDEIKRTVDNSFIKELTDITNSLTSLKQSWEKFSFYQVWQEKYKNWMNVNYWWNNSNIENDSGEGFLDSLKSSLPKVESYQDMFKQYLPSLKKAEPVCTAKEFTCPDNKQKFTTDACCSPFWLSIGAPLGLGNECWIDLNGMVEQCNVFSCYGLESGNFNSSDGCTYIPDVLLNYEACVIHDLCYVTPGVTKRECDDAMQDNINKIYCENVNTYERRICSARASIAATALEWTDKYFVAAGLAREKCQLSDSLLTRIWKYSFTRMFRPLF